MQTTFPFSLFGAETSSFGQRNRKRERKNILQFHFLRGVGRDFLLSRGFCAAWVDFAKTVFPLFYAFVQIKSFFSATFSRIESLFPSPPHFPSSPNNHCSMSSSEFRWALVVYLLCIHSGIVSSKDGLHYSIPSAAACFPHLPLGFTLTAHSLSRPKAPFSCM